MYYLCSKGTYKKHFLCINVKWIIIITIHIHFEYLYPTFPRKPRTAAAPNLSIVQFFCDDVREAELSAAASR